ncbi:hypothetical protein [Stygiolobus caldivivus]|uniref:Uncharacterized protein n=1 Tax=Stygiolobus caldivivus TaxID=2824673 RepID=A0A8D5ZK31_9CREN|nr:hypothetical protein [Stygiolobus caldivivus]BCU70817.1 hypothetical protein KN1_21140 [Stygiolobus caldivivus]
MRVPVYVSHRELEELCRADGEYAICDDYNTEYEYTVDEVEFERADLEEIVDEYLDDVLDILLKGHRDKLMKALAKTC